MSKKDFLGNLAGTLEGDFEMIEVIEDGDAAVLLVKNSDASAIVGASLSTVLDSGVIRISSIVVENIEIEPETLATGTLMVNRLNQDAPIGRWVFYPERGTIDFEEEQLIMQGQDYDAEEVAVFRFLMNSIYATIDHIDDDLLESLGSGNLASEVRPVWG